MNILEQIDKSWTLFLDRDGVINEEKIEDYILNWNEFRFYDRATDAISILSRFFGTVVIVTNQRGIGKGLMTDTDLHDIHNRMTTEIVRTAGRIDRIYYCSDLDNQCHDRKPNPGMAFQAQRDFPGLDFNRSVMVGNKLSDMRFGRNAGMFTVHIASTNPEIPYPHPDIDLRYNSLYDFALHIEAALTKS